MGVLRSRSEQGPTPGSLWVCSLSFSFFLFLFSFSFFFFFSQFLGLVPSQFLGLVPFSSSSLFGVAGFCHLVSRAQSGIGRSSTKTRRLAQSHTRGRGVLTPIEASDRGIGGRARNGRQ